MKDGGGMQLSDSISTIFLLLCLPSAIGMAVVSPKPLYNGFFYAIGAISRTEFYQLSFLSWRYFSLIVCVIRIDTQAANQD